MARGGVIGRIGPEMTPECDCTAGEGGAGGIAGLAGGAAAGLAAEVFTAGFAAGGSSAFGA
jgi:hypothetical protein